MSRELNGRIGALESWSRTVDRTARTQKARENSPNSIEYHLARVPAEITDPEQRLKAAQEALSARMSRLAAASAKKRRKNKAA